MVFIHPVQFSAQFVTQLVITAATIGALATVIFKFVSSLSGKSMKSLLKDDVFGVFYTQLLYCGNLRQQLLKGETTLENFVSQVKSLSQSASEIYGTQQTAEEKKAQLRQLLENVLGEDADDCVNVLDKALQSIFIGKVAKLWRLHLQTPFFVADAVFCTVRSSSYATILSFLTWQIEKHRNGGPFQQRLVSLSVLCLSKRRFSCQKFPYRR